MGRFAVAVLVMLAMAPSALAHGGHDHEARNELIMAGERLMIGSFSADQQGPLLVVPFLDEPLLCYPEVAPTYLIPISDNVSVSLVQNQTHIAADFVLDNGTQAFTAVALDTGEAFRALLLMTEYVVSVHRLAAAAGAQGDYEFRDGHVGIPHVAGPSAHGISHPLEGGGMSISYQEDDGPGEACLATDDRIILRFERARLGEKAQPGRVLHSVLLHDANFDQFLPRPIDDSTAVFQANLYLARPGEDPASLRAAFEPRAGTGDWVPLSALGIGLIAVAATARRPRDD